LAVLGNYINVVVPGNYGLTLNNFVSGGTLTLIDFGTAYTVANSAFASGANDVLNLVTSYNLTGLQSNAAFGSITAAQVENINITTVDTALSPDGAWQYFVTLVDNSAKTITVKGNAGLDLTAASTALTSLDASGLTLGHLSFTSGALASAATIKGSLLGGDMIDASLAAAGVTITEYAGSNTITGSAGHASTLTGGSGNDTITGGSAKDTIIGGGGADVIIGGGGADSITLSGSNAKFVNAAYGDSGANTATQQQVSELATAFDIVRGVVAGDSMQLYTATPSINLAATNLAGTDNDVNFARGTYDAGGAPSLILPMALIPPSPMIPMALAAVLLMKP